MNGLTSPGSGVIQVVSGQLNSSLVQAIARKGQNNPDVLGSEQVVNRLCTSRPDVWTKNLDVIGNVDACVLFEIR